MAKKNDNHIIHYSEGTGRNLGKAVNKTKSWLQFKDMFKKPARSSERVRDYKKMGDSDQKHLKSFAGWLYRTQIEGKNRNRNSGLPSDLLSMDFDYTSIDFLNALINCEIMSEWEWFLHTTRSHDPDVPRFRLYILLKEPVTNDMYGAVSRIAASYLDASMENVDRVSFRPAQMMYKPTASKDQEYIYHENQGEAVDWDELLTTFEMVVGDWRVITNLPKVPDEHLRESAEKMEDPTQKKGMVGAFCRTYDIFDAMAEFDLPYTESDTSTDETPRFTYTLGGSSDGAIVYDGGMYLYSHHGTDPVSDMEVNAFDLVRMHKFGDLDKDTDHDTPMAKRPSWIAMVELCQEDKKVRHALMTERFHLDDIEDDFDDDMVNEEGDEGEDDEDDEDDFADIEYPVAKVPDPSPEQAETVVGLVASAGSFSRPKRKAPSKEWFSNLQATEKGAIISNLPNVTQILDNDKRVRNSVALNEHMQEIVLIRPLNVHMPFVPIHEVRDSVNGDLFEESHMTAVRTMLEAEARKDQRGYEMKIADRDVKGALVNMSRQAKFHPVQEYLNYCRKSHAPDTLEEAMELVGGLWSSYIGSPDDAYHRDTAVKFMVACVARAFEPGHKFDYSPILHGAQGVGKSTFVAILAQHWYGELSADFDNPQKLVEQMQGCWIMELPELSSITRGQVEDVKAFISGTSTKARLAYNARAGSYLRQTCFIGSTNDTEFLIDTTGNRRWWPIEVLVDAIDLERLRDNVQALWGAATMIYEHMRTEQPEGFLALYLSDPEVRERAEAMQQKARVESNVDLLAADLFEYLDKPHLPEDDFHDVEGGVPIRERKRRVCVNDIREYLDNPMGSHLRGWSKEVGQALKKLGWYPADYAEKVPKWGTVRVYKPGPEVLGRWYKEDKENNAEGSGDDDDTMNLV